MKVGIRVERYVYDSAQAKYVWKLFGTSQRTLTGA